LAKAPPRHSARFGGVTRHPGILEWDWRPWVGSGTVTSMQAIETTGVVDDQHQLRLDTPLPIPGASRVRVIVLWPEPAELDEAEWLRTASVNPAFDFLKEETEDLYTVHDGKPFQNQG
jgi:hypothetical protein